MELVAEKNGQLTERRETEFVEKRRKKTKPTTKTVLTNVLTEFVPFNGILFQNMV